MKVGGIEAELHVKPYQKPWPPLWFPSSNRDGIEFTARHGYHTAFIGKHSDCKPLFERYREVWEKRSEERRVGKECRCEWKERQEKKKDNTSRDRRKRT